MITGYLLLCIMILLTAGSQILVKRGALRIKTGQGAGLLIRSAFNIPLVIGTAAVVAAPVFYINALSLLPLNRAFSFNGLGYVLVIILSRFFLHEKLSLFHITGGLCILSGFIIWNAGGAG